MLLWSKSQMQQFKPEKKSVSIEDIFAYLKSMFATNENISFTFFCNEENLMIETDEDYLKAIIQNLTTNAVKAVKNIDPAKIEWVAGRTENNKCFLSIKDNGPGINSDNIKALFDETETTSVKHGLGLHIIRDLAKAIHCTIQVVPGIDKGTGFILSF
jgi:C4-dicarboxylate-specific signal transduction histidine kinase